MLACLRKLIHFYDRTVNGNWKNNSHGVDLYELRNKTIGILGFGKIGKSCHYIEWVWCKYTLQRYN